MCSGGLVRGGQLRWSGGAGKVYWHSFSTHCSYTLYSTVLGAENRDIRDTEGAHYQVSWDGFYKKASNSFFLKKEDTCNNFNNNDKNKIKFKKIEAERLEGLTQILVQPDKIWTEVWLPRLLSRQLLLPLKQCICLLVEEMEIIPVTLVSLL